VTDRRRIDVHQHVIFPEHRDWLAAHGITKPSGGDMPSWSPAQAIATMDDTEVATAVVSVPTPGVHLGDDAEAAVITRRVNELSAELVKDRPDRFGFFATVPLPDVDGAVEAASRALDELSADGVMLLANSNGRYLGHPDFEPLLAELDRRSAVVFVHPTDLPSPPVPGIGPPPADYPLDTTRAAINLVRVGAIRRYPRITYILAHAGGFLPYQANRIAGWLSTYAHDGPSYHVAAEGARPAVADEAMERLRRVLEDMATFHFDVALSAPHALPSLLAFARPGHVHFGSDWPFLPDVAVRYYTAALDDFADMDPDTRRSIDRGAAEALFPRLA
jgi:predicted TIM-barrel fold metal-dependent hydrolase